MQPCGTGIEPGYEKHSNPVKKASDLHHLPVSLFLERSRRCKAGSVQSSAGIEPERGASQARRWGERGYVVNIGQRMRHVLLWAPRLCPFTCTPTLSFCLSNGIDDADSSTEKHFSVDTLY